MQHTTLLLLFFAIVGLSGCVTKNPPMIEHRLYVQKESIAAPSQGACQQKDIKVSLAFAKSALMSQKMRYVEDNFHEYAFAHSEWAQSPNRALTQEIYENIRDSALFRSVQNHNSRSKSDYILESNIEEFVQHFDEELEHSYAVVRLSFVLIDAKSSKVMESLSLEKRVQSETLDAQGGVKALSQALQEVLGEQRVWLQKVCQ